MSDSESAGERPKLGQFAFGSSAGETVVTIVPVSGLLPSNK
jgi:hypothetical protein